MNKLKNLNRNTPIKKRIYLGFSFILLAMTLAALFGVYNLEVARKNFRRYDQLNERMVSIVEIDNLVVELQRNISLFAIAGHLSTKKKALSIIEVLNTSLDNIDGLLIYQSEKDMSQKMRIHLKTYSQTFSEAIEEYSIRNNFVDQKLPTLLEKLKKSSPHKAIIPIEAKILKYLQDPSWQQVKTINQEITALMEKKSVPRSQGQGLEELKKLVLRLSQATRSYMYLTNVVMSGEALEFKYISKKIKKLIN